MNPAMGFAAFLSRADSLGIPPLKVAFHPSAG